MAMQRMPMTPGNPSDSGIPRERPMPGPLPPTSNPFGKRQSMGAIDENTGDITPSFGGSFGTQLSGALKAVNDALSYGRRLHGLEGGQDMAAASRMPVVPGNQSESGLPRERPAPGPLPPTSNPFGKRTEAEQPAEEAIDTDEETA